MRKLLIGGIAVVALATGSAMAADMPVTALPMAPVATPVYNWTGFYIGGNAGAAWGSFDPSTSTNVGSYFVPSSVPVVNAAGIQSIKPSSFTGGFETGYNWQASNIVFGVEGDIESFRLRGSATSTGVYPCCAPFTFTVTSNANTSWLATARGRLGIAANNWLFFATGGAAFTTLKGNFAFSDNAEGATESASISSTRPGYTVGGGVEAGLSSHWTVKAEYLFVDFGAASVNSNNLNTTCCGAYPTKVFTHSIDLQASIARVGINYRF